MFKWLFIILFISCNQATDDKTRVEIQTNFGEIEVQLFPEGAPKTVNAFLSFVDSGYYNNSSFYRVLKSEDLPTNDNTGLIQGGIYLTNENKIKASFIPHEPTNISGLSHTDGTLSLARTDPGTGSTEFFICIGDQSPLDHGRRGTPDSLGMAAFGKVIKGMNIVRKIQAQQSNGDLFVKPVSISRIKKL